MGEVFMVLQLSFLPRFLFSIGVFWFHIKKKQLADEGDVTLSRLSGPRQTSFMPKVAHNEYLL